MRLPTLLLAGALVAAQDECAPCVPAFDVRARTAYPGHVSEATAAADEAACVAACAAAADCVAMLWGPEVGRDAPVCGNGGDCCFLMDEVTGAATHDTPLAAGLKKVDPACPERVCARAMQTCVDADQGAAGTWACRCGAPLAGEQLGGPAMCTLDECEEDGRTCARNGRAQVCTDPDHSMAARGDWMCMCVAPAMGQRVGGVAVCAVNECMTPTFPLTDALGCAAAGQICEDPDASVTGDARCRCPPPARDTHVGGAVAACGFNECETHTDTCGQAGQRCVDPDVMVVGDWRCECFEPATGAPVVGGPAACVALGGDCAANGHVCSDAGQQCDSGMPPTMGARRVRLEKTEPVPGYLTVCEVEVMAGGVNVALNKPASQSTQQFATRPAGVAVDGNTDPSWYGFSCTHSVLGVGEWWEVDLGQMYDIELIRVTNRGDCCADRLQGVEMTLLDESNAVVAMNVLSGDLEQEYGFGDDPREDGDYQCHCPPPSVGVPDETCKGEAYEVATPMQPFGYLECGAFQFSDGCSCDTAIRGAFVEIEDPSYEIEEDTLSCPGCAALGINEQFLNSIARDHGSGILKLTGVTTIAEYTQAIASVEFVTTSAKGHGRRLTYNFGHAEYAMGHFYEHFSVADCDPVGEVCSWEQAQTFCASRENDMLGLPGYLATLTSKAEFEAIKNKVLTTDEEARGHIWLGAHDVVTEGEFRWTTGPEGCAGAYDLSVDGPERTSCNVYPLQDGTVCPPGAPGCAPDLGTLISTGTWMNLECAQADDFCWWRWQQPDNAILPVAENFMQIVGWGNSGHWNDCSWDGGDLFRGDTSVICEWGGVGEACMASDHMHGTACLSLHEAASGVSGWNGPAHCELDECSVVCVTCAASDDHANLCEEAGQRCEDPNKEPSSRHDWLCYCQAPYAGQAPQMAAMCQINECTNECPHCAKEVNGGHTCEAAGQTCRDNDEMIVGNWECLCLPPQSPAPCHEVEVSEAVAPFSALDCRAFQFSDGCSCDTAIRGAFVEIEDPSYEIEEDTLSCPGCAALGINEQFLNSIAMDHGSGILKLTGATTIAEYTQAIASVEFVTTSAKGHGRRLTYNFGHAEYAMGHFYEHFSVADCDPVGNLCSWEQAQTFCASRENDMLGLPGYLATLTSKAEFEAIKNKVLTTDEEARGHIWLGAHDVVTEGEFRWTTGPEGCADAYDLSVDGPERTSCNVYPLQDGTVCPPGAPGCAPDLGTLISTGTWRNLECAQADDFCWWTWQQPDNAILPVAENFMQIVGWGNSGHWNDCSWDGGDLFRGDTSVICEWGGVGEACMDKLHGRACVRLVGHMDTVNCELDECVMNQLTCLASGQQCVDPDKNVDSIGDWECRCAPPSSSVAVAAVAECVMDECDIEALTNWQVCDDAGQDCVDVDQAVQGDWECRCVTPSSGVATGRAVVRCTLDECNVVCATCADAGAGHVCDAAGQGCTDPVADHTSVGDWKCVCGNGAATATAAAVASCAYDECVGVSSAARSCEHVRRYTVDGCLCECGWTGSGGAACAGGCCDDMTGSERCAIADDEYNRAKAHCVPAGFGVCAVWSEVPADGGVPLMREPLDTVPADQNNVCTDAEQRCIDRDMAAPETWGCECIAPLTGIPGSLAVAAVCVLDECTTHGAVCAEAAQDCNDPDVDPASTGDWQCVCRAPTGPNATVGAAAVCNVDECGAMKSDVCTTCAGDVCSAVGQACSDPDTGVLGDWACVCIPPLMGMEAVGPAACSLNECMQDPTCMPGMCNVCEEANQTCSDPDNSTTSVGDWTCTCMPPSTTTAAAAAAVCQYNECSVEPSLRCGTQQCRDPDFQNEGDWTCECVAPSYGTAVGGQAMCQRDECDEHAATCTGAGQHCVDADLTADNTWTCECVAPDVGPVGMQGAATCTSSIECDINGAVCTSAGQHCVDPDNTTQGDWVCECIEPYVEVTPGAQATAVCELDECATACGTCARHSDNDTDFCAVRGQACRDPDRAVESNWVCECAAPATGVPVTMAEAACELDECTAACVTCAQGACGDQTCADRNTSVAKLSDWVCRCAPPSQNEATGMRVETCTYDECSDAAAAKVCEDAGQVCFDPDTEAGPGQNGTTPVQKVQFLRISRAAKGYLTICELEVISGGANVAEGKAATQSSLAPYGGGEAHRAVDGNPSGMWADMSCTHTKDEPEQWFEVDLGAEYPVTEVLVYNRQDCCSRRLSGAVLQLMNATRDVVVEEILEHHVVHSYNYANNWECRCLPPAYGHVAGAPATCEVDECALDLATCPMCAGTTCSDAGQACEDPTLTTYNDWMCLCALPANGTAVGAAVAAGDCVLDECTATCMTCADMGGGNVCDNEGQTCEDPVTTTASTGDWTCRCGAPLEALTAAAAAVVCALDECAEGLGGAGAAGRVCADAGQACRDGTLGTLGDFVCTCAAPEEGSATGAAANCTLDECLLAAPNATCSGAGQSCTDGDLRVRDTWQCVCPAPSTGSAAGAAAECATDECAVPENAAACTEAVPMQTCVDPDTAVDGDWRCECAAPATGVAVGATAECVLDECAADCATCARGACIDAGQECEDADTSVGGTGGWVCKCVAPAVGEATMAAAACVLDECEQHGEVCRAVSQSCVDPVQTPGSAGDWKCECLAPATGSQAGAAAECRVDECVANAATCSAAGQACVDTDTAEDALGDWECRCAAPATETAVTSVAVCTYLGDCGEAAVEAVCAAGGQICVDNDMEVNGVWRCACVAPSVGLSQDNAAAHCELDECKAECATCAGRACTDADQDCVDVDKDPVTGLSSWECRCIAPREGAQVGGVATCTLDECVGNAATCTAAGQECYDSDNATKATWGCRCAPPATQTALGAPAECFVDECDGNMACAAAGQACNDPDTGAESLNDWVCECPLPTSGSKVGGAAMCTYDECNVYGATCTAAGQTCVDKDAAAMDTWWCQCAGDAMVEAEGAAAQCAMDECAAGCAGPTCAGTTCSAAGQACQDADTGAHSLSDWSCVCPAPTTTAPALTAPARCQNNECEGNSVCGAGQGCDDPDWEVEGDWSCVCDAPMTGEAVTTAATCTLDECGEAGGVCAAAAQECVDPDHTTDGDWECRCPASSVMGSAVMAAADCTPPPESECRAGMCPQGQACRDPDETQDGDWLCECVAPATGGAGMQGAATCVLDECTAECAHCAGETCSAEGQHCEDPEKTYDAVNDWACVCDAPRRGSAVGAKASCTIDECAAVCDHCANNGTGNICSRHGQRCRDPDTDARAANDWVCECASPATGGATGMKATCVLNECEVHGHRCGDAAACVDPNTQAASTDDWSCTCVSPATGTAVGKAPVCQIDECNAEANLNVCRSAGQTCVDADPSPGSTMDWECHCPTTTAFATAAAATCVLDECTATCATCATRAGANVCEAVGQTCEDPTSDPFRTGDWRCVCAGGSPKAVGTPAACSLDECTQVSNYGAQTCEHTPRYTVAGCKCQCGWTLAGAFGPGADSPCMAGCCNPDRAASGAWCIIDQADPENAGKAECQASTRGTCVAAAAAAGKNMCADMGQECIDPSPTAKNVLDWQCKCVAPAQGTTATGRPATCAVDECVAEGATCTAAGQTCVDPSPVPGDWMCVCVAPETGAAGRAAAAHCLLDECAGAAGATCTDAGQSCRDLSRVPSDTGDWECVCLAPSSGASVTAGVAACTLDECASVCPTCAGTTCSDAKQTCTDPSTDPESKGDWVCACAGGASGAETTGAPAACTLDECTATCWTCAGMTCSAEMQACTDPSPTVGDLGDWMCSCMAPATGANATGQAALCDLDECNEECDTCAGTTCDDAGQECVDMVQHADSLGNWFCMCVAPAKGASGVGKPATCSLNECTAQCDTCAGTTCEDAGQVCKDFEQAGPDSLGTWVCACPAEAAGEPVEGAPATCVLDECAATCGTCAGRTCSSAGQDCEDADMSLDSRGDWSCACAAPATGASVTGGTAVCELDECTADCDTCAGTTCSSATPPQTCVDAAKGVHALRSWTCECGGGATGSLSGAAATCVLDECALDSVCAAGGQRCEDADTDPLSKGDWRCVCQGSGSGSAEGALATCTYPAADECGDAANRQVCAAAEQSCADPDTSATGNWLCECIAPSTGVVGMMGAGVCTLDECAVECPMCADAGAGNVCEDAGQRCTDTDTRAASTGDWQCECAPGASGSPVEGGPATCAVDECREAANRQVCEAAGQECVDLGTTAQGNWQCKCVAPARGLEVGAVATCTLNECAVGANAASCTRAGQRCEDKNWRATDDWVCKCKYPSVGAERTMGPAECVTPAPSGSASPTPASGTPGPAGAGTPVPTTAAPEAAGAAPAADEDDGCWWCVLLIVLAVCCSCCLAAAAFFVVKRRDRKAEEEGAWKTVGSPKAREEERPEFNKSFATETEMTKSLLHDCEMGEMEESNTATDPASPQDTASPDAAAAGGADAEAAEGEKSDETAAGTGAGEAPEGEPEADIPKKRKMVKKVKKVKKAAASAEDE